MAPSYARLPTNDESSDTPLSLIISVGAASPTPDHTAITIPRISPTNQGNYVDYDYFSDDDACEPPIGGETPKFIRVVGQPIPSCSGEEPLKVDPTTGLPIKPTASSVVLSAGVDHENVLIEVVDAQAEDPFTLEAFDSLIQMHVDKDKDFILARVTTVDPKDETRFYYSYYAAHHINKVLFRTQPEEGLLHRMKAKNPLNNMTIVGDVHYFVVSAAQLKAQQSAMSPGRASFDSVRSATSMRSITSIRSVNSIRSMMSVFSTASVSSTGSNRREFDRFQGTKPGLGRLLGLGQHGVRKRTLHLMMKPEAVDHTVEEVALLTEAESSNGKGYKGKGHSSRNRLRPCSAESLKDAIRKPSRSRRNSMDDIYADGISMNMTTEAVAASAAEPTVGSRSSLDGPSQGGDANVRTGSTTPKIHRRVRSISFANEVDVLDDASADNDQPKSATINRPGRPTNITLPLIHNTRRPAFPPAPNGHRPRRTPLLEQALSPCSPGSYTPEPFYFTAKYYATDDDFLMKSNVRAYFKENALETSDAVLFTIPSSREDTEVLDGAEDHPALLGFMYAVSEEDEEGFFSRGNGTSGLKWLLLTYIIIGFVLIKYIVPDAYAYIIAFLLIFLLCLVMILCL
ncbi:hypothetical protein DFS34DRAFT_584913 [Phlyctochytrium arcticum]|nr:hypothetical protein DFS34DRAFT_584913 [Phlyctochytrium arcticum]